MPERFAFVKDGFSWPALFVPILWILWHRLWLALVWYIVFVLVVAWTGRLVERRRRGRGGLSRHPAACAGGATTSAAPRSQNRGWEEVGASFGRNLDEAEARFFAEHANRLEEADRLDRRAAMLRAAYTPEHVRDDGDEPILGLFPEPER